MRKWLNDNSTNDLFSFSSSTDSCPMILITDDEEDKEDVIIINNSDSSGSNNGEDMTMTIRQIDKIVDRGESMILEQRFNATVESAAVQNACDEVSRIMNLDSDDDDDYIPSTDTIMHVLQWLSIEVITSCASMQWRERVADKVRDALIDRYMQGMN